MCTRILSSTFRPFAKSNRRIIGVLNITGEHWIAFYIDQRTKNFVDPLIRSKLPLAYVSLACCKQRDGSSCGVLGLAVLELLISGKTWTDELYELIAYLRLRYLNKSIILLAQGSGERGVRLYGVNIFTLSWSSVL
ncbi:hypothetical protein JG687_00005349 [Phytophthora cactorum]|uniref:Ubiquitin-like protease family profile domain-containing protein n=1 Tax=Phytophthora cactorum TaxID=29920 RepID=A0A8T1UMH7_9STRA|nr:hypothetical protein GQ600_13060 [Phytophthora cactorum]KAF1773760.1 hypothetical protein GQ600_13061 [Phytophthora cactorum]KAG6965592.1 hypothetical protein JG687_00005349 [Phytophthora cactorum]